MHPFSQKCFGSSHKNTPLPLKKINKIHNFTFDLKPEVSVYFWWTCMMRKVCVNENMTKLLIVTQDDTVDTQPTMQIGGNCKGKNIKLLF